LIPIRSNWIVDGSISRAHCGHAESAVFEDLKAVVISLLRATLVMPTLKVERYFLIEVII